MYSFFERQLSSGAERCYYPPLQQPYLKLSAKTVFSVEFLQEVSINLEILWVSFAIVRDLGKDEIRPQTTCARVAPSNLASYKKPD